MGSWKHPLAVLFPIPVAWFAAAAQEGKTHFNVGVILDRGSWIGDVVGWSCIKMSLRDFYEENPHYKTRLRLHLRTLNGRFLQPPRLAKFVMALGSKSHVPIISFSATSASLSSGQTQYFIRTTFNDTIQAEAIASLVQYFNWRQVIPIFEDDEHGNGIVPFLIDTFQANGVCVPHRSRISSLATREQILEELNLLKGMQTRVFVVHMSHHLGFKLFSCAQEAGMMEEGYVWIVTYDLTDLLDHQGSSASSLMQGVLGVEPYFRETKRLSRFKVRWKEECLKEHPDINATEPSAFGLWAYDTVQALARAVESTIGQNSSSWQYEYKINSTSDLVGYSTIGPKLLDSILHTNFNGLTGKFKLTNQKLSMPTLEIVNVIGDGKQRVGFWKDSLGISGRIDASGGLKHIGLKNITWPGDVITTPKGWEWPTNNNTLRIGIPVKPGFSEFVDMDVDPITLRSVGNDFRGYCIEVFNAVIKRLPYHVPYKYIPSEDSMGNMNGCYDELVYQVYLKNFDAVVGDITILANRSLYVDFTLPFTESGVIMVVPVKDYNNKSAWAFLEPMTGGLWLASGLFFVLTGIIVWALEHRVNDQFRGPVAHQMGTIFYFSFSTLVFAHRERLRNNLSRIVVIIWLFTVLVLTSSYTASLTSLLTVRQIMPIVTNIDHLIRDSRKVGCLSGSFMLGFLKRMQFRESNLRAYNSLGEYNDALSNGSVAAIFDEIPHVKVFLSKFRGKYMMVGPTYKRDGFGFVFPKGSPLVTDISRAILNFTETGEFRRIQNELYKNRLCSDQTTESASTSLTLDSFWGLFLVTGATSSLALALHLASSSFEHQNSSRNSEGSSLWQNFTFLFKPYGQQDPTPHAPDDHGPRETQAMETMVFHGTSQSPSNLSDHTDDSADDENGMGTP